MEIHGRIRKCGNSFVVTIPYNIVDTLQLRYNDRITLEIKEVRRPKEDNPRILLRIYPFS